MQILNPLSPKEKKKKKMQKKKERKERGIKMGKYLRELDSEMEAKQKRKRKREQKKLRRKKMMMTEEEKKMMEEKEKEEEKKDEEEWRKMKEEDEELWKGWEREQKMKSQLPAPVEWTIKKGDKFDITHLLSSRKRDHLIKNNGDKVN